MLLCESLRCVTSPPLKLWEGYEDRGLGREEETHEGRTTLGTYLSGTLSWGGLLHRIRIPLYRFYS